MFMLILTGRAPGVHFPLLLRKPLKKETEKKNAFEVPEMKLLNWFHVLIEKNTHWLALFSLFIWLFECNDYNN